jgi:transcriptional regulator with XRE-family HTH domain
MYANHIRVLRRERGLSATEVAYRAGCGVGMLWRYERGEVEPPLGTARAIARVLEATLDEAFPPASVVAT